MAQFTVTFTIPSDDDWYDESGEIEDRSAMIARTLRAVATRVESAPVGDFDDETRPVRDANGNSIGSFTFTR